MKPISELELSFQFDKDTTLNKEEIAKPVFEEYVYKTSQLIKRPYFQTFKLVEDWQEHKIIRRYNDVMNYSGEIPKDILWWSLRKKENQKSGSN